MDWYPGDAVMQEAWMEAAGLAASWAIVVAVPLFLIAVALAITREVRRERVACPALGRTVELEVVELGLPGHRHPSAVRSCSAFCPATAVTCDRRCLRESRLLAA